MKDQLTNYNCYILIKSLIIEPEDEPSAFAFLLTNEINKIIPFLDPQSQGSLHRNETSNYIIITSSCLAWIKSSYIVRPGKGTLAGE